MALILPSLLSADLANLGRDVRLMEDCGARMLHVDVMDGHFVPNLTFGLPILKRLREITDCQLDVHLMISNPEQMAEAYVESGADWVSVHYETVTHLDRLLGRIEELGARPGVALNPHTPVSVLEDVLAKCRFVLIMSVNPGFGGQEFIPQSFKKVRQLKTMAQTEGVDLKIQIDGAIGPHNVAEAVACGVDWLVSGSAIFGARDPAETFKRMQELASIPSDSETEAQTGPGRQLERSIQ